MPNILGIDVTRETRQIRDAPSSLFPRLRTEGAYYTSPGQRPGRLAVVQQPENRVLWCGTLHLSDKIKKLYELRRILRRSPRSRLRYRKPKVQERG